jgi:NAD(P)-dependent dehydrogenase (short-subunit alcohol dehydrogenase family)
VGLALSVGARHLRPQEAGYEVDLSSIPLQLAGMEGRQLPADEAMKEYLEADLMRTLAYGEDSEQITVNIIYGATWRTVHTPAQCYPAAGWSIVEEDDAIVPVAAPLPHPDPVLGRVIEVERDEAVQLVLFVFAHKGGTSIDYAEHSWAVATGPPGAGGLSLMLTSPVFSDREAVRERLIRLAGELYPHAIAFWYSDWEPPPNPHG